MTEALQGWHPDPFGRHEVRYFSAGRPTYLVRDGRVEGSDPVEDIPPQPEPGFASAAEWAAPAPEWSAPETLPAPAHQPDQDPYAPPPWSVAPGAPRANTRHSARARRGRMPVVAAAAVVVVVVVVALAVSRHPRSSTAGASSRTGPTTSSSYAMPVTGMIVVSAGGHFSAYFPSMPAQESDGETIAGVHATTRVAVVESPITEVVEGDLSSPVPTNYQSVALRGAIAELVATVADGTPTTQSDTIFRGNAAQTATFTTPTGVKVTVMAFFYDPSTVYCLVAGEGAPFKALSDSFEFRSASSPPVIS